jgi:hypothetical protein
MRSVRQLGVAVRGRSRTLDETRFLQVPLSDVRVAHAETPPEAGVLDLVTVAYNSRWAIEEQIRRLRANLRDPFRYTVLNNSSRMSEREAIESLCDDEQVGHVSLPNNPGANPSTSHGLALTWAWRHFLAPRNAQYVGFVDHDVFPMRSTHVISRLGLSGVYGYQQERQGVRYLWPGFCFFERRVLEGVAVDFRPKPGLDTGGGLWPLVFSKLERSSVSEPIHRYETLSGEGDLKVEYFDEWLHTINASNWMPADSRAAFVRKWLEGI